jgi:hypothetical protein
VFVVVGGTGVVVVVLRPQFAVQAWRSEAQIAAPVCAADRHPARHARRSEAVLHPVAHVFAVAATLRAQVPRSSPHAPRQDAVDGSSADEGGVHDCAQLARSLA